MYDPSLTEADINAALHDRRISPEPVSDSYALRLTVVFVAMTLLFLLYITIIALAGRAVYWLATENSAMIAHDAGYFHHMLYIILVLAGGIFLVGFLRPFWRRERPPEMVYLQRDQDPLLFAFIEHVCAVMNCPVPHKIAVTCDPNTSIGYQSGIMSAFRRRGTLCIGLPLVRVLNIRELSGIIVHELGHLNQKQGIFGSLMIMSILSWFAYNVFERGYETKRNDNDDLPWPIGVAKFVARISFAITRFVLAIILVLGSLVTTAFRRKMELNADRYGARMAGRTVYGTLLTKMDAFYLAWAKTAKTHIMSWRDRRLSDDLSLYVVHRYRQASKNPSQESSEDDHEARTYGDHPPMDDRIKNIADIPDEGTLTLERPAVALFRDEGALAREATLLFYRYAIGRVVSRDHIVPAEKYLQEEIAEEERRDARSRVFQDLYTGRSPFTLSDIDGIETGNSGTLVDRLKACHQEIAEILPLATEAEKGYRDLLKEFLRIGVARSLMGDKIDVAFSMELVAPERLSSRLDELKPAINEKKMLIDRFTRLLCVRIALATTLLKTASFRERMHNVEETEREFTESLAMVMRFDERYRFIEEIMNDLDHLFSLQKHVSGIEKDDNFDRSLRKYSMGIQRKMASLRKSFGEIPYPFHHSRGNITVSEYAFKKNLPIKEIDRMCAGILETLFQLLSLHARIMGRMALALEKVEQASTLPPFAAPATREKRDEAGTAHEDDILLYELDEL